MATYKLSLLGLFLIILGALIVSMLVGNWFQTSSKEGMISYQYDVDPLTNVFIPNYSTVYDGDTKNVTKKYGQHVILVYDNIYFDTDNANLIEMDGSAYSGNVDLTGNSISSISVSSHNNNNNSKKINTFVWNTTDSAGLAKLSTESKREFKKSYFEYDYITTSLNTDKYQVFVLPWNDSTYIHVINLTKKTNVITICFGPEHTSQSKVYDDESNALPFTNNKVIYDSEPHINSYFENTNIFVLSGQTLFEEKTKLLCMLTDTSDTPTIKCYNQQGNYVLPTQLNTQTVSKTTFTPFILYDEIGNKMVLTVTNGPHTLIAIFETNPSYNNYRVFNVKRFGFVDKKAVNVNGIDPGPSEGNFRGSTFDYNPLVSSSSGTTSGSTSSNSGSTSSTSTTTPSTSGSTTFPPTNPNSPDMMNDYYRWFYYWATQGLNNNPNSPGFNYSDDYIMKTQIVPPVCPSCPSCPSTGTCTNCGGNGGSGTKSTNNGTSLVGGGNENTNFNYAGNGITISSTANTIGGVLNNAINQPANITSSIGNTLEKGASGAVDLAKDTGSGAVNLAKDTGSGAVNLVKDTGSGAVNLVKDTASGVVGLGKDIVGGTVDLGKDIVDGIVNLGNRYESTSNQVGSNQYGYANSYGGSAANQLLPKNNSSVVDHSNMYGAMPNKGKSNYMPLGSDFSKFGR